MYSPRDPKDSFELTFSGKDYESKKDACEDKKVSCNIDINEKMLRQMFHLEKNGDIIVRKFNCVIGQKRVRGIIVFADGLANKTLINDFILEPLMQNSLDSLPEYVDMNFFTQNLIPQVQATEETSMKSLVQSVNIGNASLFLDGCKSGASFDVKTWEHRGVDSPVNEEVVQGPREGFNEILRCNTALIRKNLNTADLVMETFFFGKISQTPASLAYIDGTVNPSLLEEVRKRIEKIDSDYILSVFDIEKHLEKNKLSPMPHIITTERPDKVARSLAEGRVALCLNGSSQAIILPANITDLLSSPEDAYLRVPYGIFIKFIRIIAVILSLLTPAVYLALTEFHTGAILTDMLIALAGADSNVPFAPLTEVLIMELAFELIKEAGVRIPGAIGSSLGIVGGLILGQSAVSAGIVSPIVIIIVSICGIASFAIPSYSTSFAFRISRFAYIFAGAFLGIVGILCLFSVQLCAFLGSKSFGVPLCVPFSPKTRNAFSIFTIFHTQITPKPQDYLKPVTNEQP